MAIKKKGKKAIKSKPTSSKKSPVKKRAARKAAPKKQAAAKKNTAKSRKAVSTAASSARRTASTSSGTRRSSQFEREKESRSAGQSGDLQGLRDTEGADSESVTELLEEGNAFEAGVVSGVEHGDDDEVQEVHTHEVPEDDVPEEYLDKD